MQLRKQKLLQFDTLLRYDSQAKVQYLHFLPLSYIRYVILQFPLHSQAKVQYLHFLPLSYIRYVILQFPLHSTIKTCIKRFPFL
jgi:hypothetical protein